MYSRPRRQSTMGTKSVVLLSGSITDALEVSCRFHLGSSICLASQYCSNLDSLAAEVANSCCNAACCPAILIYGCFDRKECLEAVLYVMQSVVQAQQQQAWTGRAEPWQLQQSSNDGDLCAFSEQYTAACCIQRTALAEDSCVQVQHLDDLRQLVLSALNKCHQSAADGCLVTWTAARNNQIPSKSDQAADSNQLPSCSNHVLHFLLVPAWSSDSVSSSSEQLDTSCGTSGSSSRPVLVVSKVLAMAGVEEQQLPTWPLSDTQQLPANIQQIIAEQVATTVTTDNSSISGTSASSRLQLLLLLPPRLDQPGCQQTALEMLQLAHACATPAAPSSVLTASAMHGSPTTTPVASSVPAEAVMKVKRSSTASAAAAAATLGHEFVKHPLIDQLNQQVRELQLQLDGAHTHYQQLLERLVPKWRQDHTAMETIDKTYGTACTAADAASSNIAVSAAAVATRTGQEASKRPFGGGSDDGTLVGSTAAGSAAAKSPSTPSTTAGRRISTTFHSVVNDVQRAVLEGQLEAARKELKAAKERAAGLESELMNATERAAAREGSLTTELKRVIVNGNDAARKAADEKATLVAQVRQLQADLSDLKSSHTAEMTSAQQQTVTLAEQLNKQLVSNRIEAAATPRHMAMALQRKAQEQVGSQQQLLTEQLKTLQAHESQLQQQQHQQIVTLSNEVAVAQKQQQQVEQQLQQLRQDADTVWNYALTLNEILCRCEAGHYPVQDASGLRIYHIPRQDKPAALSTVQIPELAQQLGIAQQYLALLKVPDPAAVSAGKLQYHSAAIATSNRPASAGVTRPYAFAGLDAAEAAAAGCHNNRSAAKHGAWMVSGTRCLVQQHYKDDLALAGALNGATLIDNHNRCQDSCGTTGKIYGKLVENKIRPHSAAYSGKRPGSAAAAPIKAHGGDYGGPPDLATAAAAAKLKRQLEKEVQADIQERAAVVLAQLNAPAVVTDGNSAVVGDADAAAPATAADKEGVATLAQYAGNLKQQLDRSREELAAERRQAAEMAIAVRSVQRMQAATAVTYLAGVTGPASPSRPSSAVGAPRSLQPAKQQQPWAVCTSPSRPDTTAGMYRHEQRQQQVVTGAGPASPSHRPVSAPGPKSPHPA